MHFNRTLVEESAYVGPYGCGSSRTQELGPRHKLQLCTYFTSVTDKPGGGTFPLACK